MRTDKELCNSRKTETCFVFHLLVLLWKEPRDSRVNSCTRVLQFSWKQTCPLVVSLRERYNRYARSIGNHFNQGLITVHIFDPLCLSIRTRIFKRIWNCLRYLWGLFRFISIKRMNLTGLMVSSGPAFIVHIGLLIKRTRLVLKYTNQSRWVVERIFHSSFNCLFAHIAVDITARGRGWSVFEYKANTAMVIIIDFIRRDRRTRWGRIPSLKDKHTIRMGGVGGVVSCLKVEIDLLFIGPPSR